MKKLLFFFGLFCFVAAGAQTKYINVSELKLSQWTKITLDKSINVQKEDTSYYIGFSFQNEKYEHITDFCVIGFSVKNDSSKVKKFISDLRLAYNEIGNKSTMSFEADNYNMVVFDTHKEVYVYEPRKKGEVYTKLNKKQIEKLLNWFNEIGFKS